MRIIKGKEILIAICISYTIINIGGSVFEAIVNQKSSLCTNNIMMLLWTSIAVFILSIHHLFDEWSPFAMILIQYIIALSLVFLTMLIGGVFEPVAKGGYQDAFLSFTIPYVIGAVVYYIGVFQSVRRQNRLLQDIIKDKDDEI